MAVTARLEPTALDPSAELARLQASLPDSTGALVSFTGLVRAENRTVEALVLDAYPALTERSLLDIAVTVARDHAAAGAPLTEVLVVHRSGRIPAGAPVVFVAVAAPHRRAAFEAADQLMDRLKTEAALWKSELTPSGPRRIEPTARDHADRARWND